MRFPMEDNARKYITTAAVSVENTVYYRRAVQDGDLILVTGEPEVLAAAEQVTGPAKTKAKKEKQAVSDE
ncbi:DUF2635 domain-containing protein [Salmonella enterica subsp. enterica serovar Brandenburg]|nr:DUF2635 domain-containing protein [Salmonella enterica subsp. enterica serovar Montevideo]ECF5615946.1 DUF2635 domain-containing protein [Salmonella enterica subsp. enterica serovar Reading]EHU4456387.1 DUF2635 domain-containing protein [Salmonella enterica]HAE0234207.1 DUF2635 domain-containing protein [Salmonella enterica subsp. enterica serovar Enteritidis str. P125109]EDE7748394.1 DUF2635 domain-containing protein [Salmonella enterica subsp. enterica serovar Montevideo]